VMFCVWFADSLLFVLKAHMVMRNSGAPSAKVLEGHWMRSGPQKVKAFEPIPDNQLW
jgi:hypothetical protein